MKHKFELERFKQGEPAMDQNGDIVTFVGFTQGGEIVFERHKDQENIISTTSVANAQLAFAMNEPEEWIPVYSGPPVFGTRELCEKWIESIGNAGYMEPVRIYTGQIKNPKKI